MVEKVNLKDTPVIDAHCFSYENSVVTRERLSSSHSMVGTAFPSLDDQTRAALGRDQGESTGAFRHRIVDLAAFLGCEPTVNAVVEARESRRVGDFQSHVKSLMDDVQIKALVVDQALQTLDAVDEFGAQFPGSYHKTLRLTTLIRDLLESSHTFDNLVADYDRAMEDGVRNRGVVAFKSIIAYRTGLNVERVSFAEAEADFNNRKEQPIWFGYRVKKVRDFLLRRALLNSIPLDTTILIHTGLGDSDIIAKECNPILLWDLLKNDEVMPAKVLLIHGGFPFTHEAVYMANALPRVHFDLSAGNGPAFLETAVSPQRFTELLRSLPLSKLVYSSDGGDPPETLWHDCVIAKRAMAAALDGMVELGVYTVDEAVKVGEDIFYNNVKTLFRI